MADLRQRLGKQAADPAEGTWGRDAVALESWRYDPLHLRAAESVHQRARALAELERLARAAVEVGRHGDLLVEGLEDGQEDAAQQVVAGPAAALGRRFDRGLDRPGPVGLADLDHR